MLRLWLKHGPVLESEHQSPSRRPSHSHSPSPSVDLKLVGETRSETAGGEGGPVNPVLLAGLIPRTSYQLKDKAIEHCLRVIDQCERSELAGL